MSVAPALVGPILASGSFGVLPVSVAHFLGPLAVKPADRAAVLGVNPVFSGQAADIVSVGFLGLAVDQPSEGGVGLDYGSVNPHVSAFDQPVLLQGA